MKSNKLGNKHGYQYVLNDLNPEQSYDINVKAIAGYKTVDPEAQHLFCLSDGPMSNTLPVMAPAAPKSPKLRLEGLHPEGIDVTWLAPQQHGEAAISVSLDLLKLYMFLIQYSKTLIFGWYFNLVLFAIYVLIRDLAPKL